MDLSDTVRESALRLLADTGEPLTAATVAERVDTTPSSAGRALRQLERLGAAVRTAGRPALWRSTEV